MRTVFGDFVRAISFRTTVIFFSGIWIVALCTFMVTWAQGNTAKEKPAITFEILVVKPKDVREASRKAKGLLKTKTQLLERGTGDLLLSLDQEEAATAVKLFSKEKIVCAPRMQVVARKEGKIFSEDEKGGYALVVSGFGEDDDKIKTTISFETWKPSNQHGLENLREVSKVETSVSSIDDGGFLILQDGYLIVCKVHGLTPTPD